MAANGHAMPAQGRRDITTTNMVTSLPDTAAIREMLGMMKASLATIGQTFQTLNQHSASISTLGPTMKDVSAEMSALRRQIKAREQEEDLRVNEVKCEVKNTLKDKIAKEMRHGSRDRIREQIQAQVMLQVQEHMDIQISEFLPMSLPQQVDESKKQIVDVKHALSNSEARKNNSLLHSTNLDDRLAVVLKPDGTKSDAYPADLRSLFSYDALMIRVLLRDYGLFELTTREENLNRFMSHIGVRFELVSVSIDSGTIPSPVELLRTA